MFVNDNGEKIFQTLAGQGWRALIQWNPSPQDAAEGFPAVTLEPVVAWVTAKISRDQPKGQLYEDVIIAPLVRWPSGDELLLLDTRDDSDRKFVFLAPGEELAQQHFDQLRDGKYAKEVTAPCV
ncbi:MAG TPA: hypothetical protein VM554_03510 [Acidisarcina sp.]|nr:hypothetical protein [Acidisarcina sp.]